MKMIIDLENEMHLKLIKLAEKDRRKTKNYIEKIIANHVNRKSKANKYE